MDCGSQMEPSSEMCIRDRVASLDNIKLVCYIELLDYEYVFIVCPDTFENAWERTEWKNNVKASNGWGSSAK